MDLIKFIEENSKINPFLIKILKKEGMSNFHAWGTVFKNIEKLENIIKSKYSDLMSFNEYHKGDVNKFYIKTSDVLMLCKIEKSILEKGEIYFKNSNAYEKKYNKKQYRLLNLLNEHLAKNNTTFDTELKSMGLYIFIKCGPSAYDFLCENLPLPSISTVRKELGLIENVVEGEVRSNKLKQHIETFKLPSYVCLSEDATRCIATVKKNNI